MRRFALFTPFLVVGLLAGCGSSSSSSSTPSSAAPTSSSPSASSGVKISTASVAGLGAVLVNSQGHTLYTFARDNHSKVTCTGSCAAIWPPVALASGAKPVAGSGVKASLLGSDPNPSGGRVVTYAWLAAIHVSHRRVGGLRGRPGTEPQRRPVVRDLGVRHSDHPEGRRLELELEHDHIGIRRERLLSGALVSQQRPPHFATGRLR